MRLLWGQTEDNDPTGRNVCVSYWSMQRDAKNGSRCSVISDAIQTHVQNPRGFSKQAKMHFRRGFKCCARKDR